MPGSKPKQSGTPYKYPGIRVYKTLKVQIYKKKQKSHPFWGWL